MFTNIWKLTDSLLNKNCAKNAIRKKILKFLEKNEKENRIYPSLKCMIEGSSKWQAYNKKNLYKV